MNYFFHIFTQVILPIFLQIATGFVLKKFLDFHVDGLARVQIYIMLPALLFLRMYDNELSGEIVFSVVINCILLFVFLYIIAFVISKLLKQSKSMTGAIVNTSSMYNCGNYSIPLMQLLYTNPIAVTVQIIIMTIQNLFSNTIGIFNANSGNKSIKNSVIDILKMPMIYAVLAGIIWKISGFELWQPIRVTAEALGAGAVPIALVTLGIQLADTKLNFKNPLIYLTCFIRLIISPIIAWLLVLVFRIDGILASILIISSAVPSSVNVSIFALQFDSESNYVSQTVFMSTILSIITLIGVILLNIENIV